MKAFLQQFYAAVNRNLGDPHSAVRFPNETKLEYLHKADQKIFEALKKVTGQETLLGYAEAPITIINGVDRYLLPPAFRQFIALGHFAPETATSSTQRVRQDGLLRTRGVFEEKFGVEILTPDKGMRINPAPLVPNNGTETWWLRYLRGPGKLHYAMASDVQSRSLTTGIPPADGGEVIFIENYYNGLEIQIYSAGNGSAPQIREVESYKVLGGKGVFQIRHAWNPLPTGEVWYEVRPTLPPDLDDLYSIDISMTELRRRKQPEAANSFMKDRHHTMAACKQYFANQTMDRTPSRTKPLTRLDKMPTGEIPYGFH